MAKKKLPYTQQHISPEDIKSVTKALKEEMITRGPLVDEFEQAITKYCGAKYGVCFNSGTSALDAAGFAAELTPFDIVYTTPNTFIGTIIAPKKLGANITFVDIEPETGNIDLSLLSKIINQPNSRGKEVILPVHFAGVAVDMARLSKMIMSPHTVVIEDAAHALGSLYPTGEKVGSCTYSDMTVFSFHPAKQITTGEGGVVTTNSEKLYEKLKQFRDNGIVRKEKAAPWEYEVEAITGNFHLTSFQAALGMSQLKKIDKFSEKRREIYRSYRKHFEPFSFVSLLPEKYDPITSYHLLAAQFDFEQMGLTKQELMETFSKESFGTQVHYIPLYKHPVINKNSRDLSPYFPQMEKYYSRELSLPLHLKVVDKHIEKMAKILSKFEPGL